jgi:hypothetical protein
VDEVADPSRDGLLSLDSFQDDQTTSKPDQSPVCVP